MVRQFDGRGPATQLTELVLAELRVPSPTELIHAIYDVGLPRQAVAGIAGVVQRATDLGDAVASEILSRAGAELAVAAASVISRLEMRGDAFPTVLAGGIFRGMPSLVDNVTTRLADIAPRSDVRLLTRDPATGAVTLALELARGSLYLPSYV